MSRRLIITLAAATILLLSCSRSEKKQSYFTFPDYDTVSMPDVEKLSSEALDDISRNISSPVEIAEIIRRMNVPFSSKYLATSVGAERASSSFDKAIKLGILGADLGYLNMYEKTGNSVDLLVSIKKLAEGINVGQFFDFETIKRLAVNRASIDSLFMLSNDSYNQIDKFLRERNSGNLSALMLTGLWIEGQYLATRVVSSNPDTLLRSRIGEQKIILNDLTMLLAPYCKISSQYSELCTMIQQLRESYRDVKVTYTTGEPQMKEVNGMLVVVQKDESRVEMTDKQLGEISSISEKIRNKLISEN